MALVLLPRRLGVMASRGSHPFRQCQLAHACACDARMVVQHQDLGPGFYAQQHRLIPVLKANRVRCRLRSKNVDRASLRLHRATKNTHYT